MAEVEEFTAMRRYVAGKARRTFCIECGKSFRPQTAWRDYKFCSNECETSWFQMRPSGEKSSRDAMINQAFLAIENCEGAKKRSEALLDMRKLGFVGETLEDVMQDYIERSTEWLRRTYQLRERE